MSRIEEGEFQGHDGTRLYYRASSADSRPRAVVVFVHGFGDHGGRHPHLFSGLAANGISLYAPDLRGYGRSAGQRGFISDWADYRQDVGLFMDLVGQRGTGLPLFLMGHSMGGLIALEYALRRPEDLRGVIASSPAVGELGVPPWKMALGRLLSRIWPRFSMNAGLDASGLTRDPKIAEQIEEDPLSHGRGTARLAQEISRSLSWTREHASELRVPLLVLLGLGDTVVRPEAGRGVFEQVRLADKSLLEYEGAYHELDNDLCRDRVVADIADWIARHLPT